MSAPFARRPPTLAVSESNRTVLALDCAQNVFDAVDRRTPEARALVDWLAENAAALGLDDASVPEACSGLGRQQRRGGTLADWRKAKAAMNAAAAVLPMLADASIHCWADAIGDALAFDPVSTRILSLALHYVLDKRVERLTDALSQCRGSPTRLNRDPSLFALMLQTSTVEIATLLAGGGRLFSNGLLQLDRQGGLKVHNRLVSLIRQGDAAGGRFLRPASRLESARAAAVGRLLAPGSGGGDRRLGAAATPELAELTDDPRVEIAEVGAGVGAEQVLNQAQADDVALDHCGVG